MTTRNTASPENNSKEDDGIAISVRNVDKDVWRKLKGLAALNDMSIADYLKYLVDKEMKHAPVSSN